MNGPHWPSSCQTCVPCTAALPHAAAGPAGAGEAFTCYTAAFTHTPSTPLCPAAEGCYLLFDLPGQVELFTLHASLRRIVDIMTRRWQFRLTAVQLVDAHLCSDPAKYMSALLLSLQTMMHLEMPQVRQSNAGVVVGWGARRGGSPCVSMLLRSQSPCWCTWRRHSWPAAHAMEWPHGWVGYLAGEVAETSRALSADWETSSRVARSTV